MAQRERANNLEAQIAELSGTVRTYMDMNTRQHEDIRELLFGSVPHSLQSQISDISDRAFGDDSTSLKSRIVEIESSAKVSKGVWAFVAAFFASLGTMVGMKWDSIIKAMKFFAR